MIIQITTTADKKEILEEIARSLLKERLIACAQIIGPIKSIYWWENQLVEDQEFLCIMKTRSQFFGLVEEKIKKLHPYRVPEIVATSLDTVSKDYEVWLENETKNRSNG